MATLSPEWFTGERNFHRNHTGFHENFLRNWYFLEFFPECIPVRLFSTGTGLFPTGMLPARNRGQGV